MTERKYLTIEEAVIKADKQIENFEKRQKEFVEKETRELFPLDQNNKKMKTIELEGNKALFVLGIILILTIIGLGTILNFIGNILFPTWWNKPASKDMIFLFLLGLLIIFYWVLGRIVEK